MSEPDAYQEAREIINLAIKMFEDRSLSTTGYKWVWAHAGPVASTICHDCGKTLYCHHCGASPIPSTDWSETAKVAKAAAEKVMDDARVDPADLQKVYRGPVASTNEDTTKEFVDLAVSLSHTDRQHNFEEAGFDTCRWCGERRGHEDHQPVALQESGAGDVGSKSND